jgi:hypothetical protein
MASSIDPHCLAVLCACLRVRTVPASASEHADVCMLGQDRQLMVELGHLLIEAVTAPIVELGHLHIDAVTASIRSVHEGQPGWTLADLHTVWRSCAGASGLEPFLHQPLTARTHVCLVRAARSWLSLGTCLCMQSMRR